MGSCKHANELSGLGISVPAEILIALETEPLLYEGIVKAMFGLVSIKSIVGIQAFWGTTLCFHLCWDLLTPEDEGTMVLRNVGNNNTA